MNKKKKKSLVNKRLRRLVSSSHVLIAVVALIECLILIGFTTYSWIETASSLVIMNGPQSTTTTGNVNIDITNKLSYQINLDSAEGNADLSNFYSHTEHFRYGKASSPDGTTFYFPKRNNTYSTATTFRLGDTTDYNTSYTYFDFDIWNDVGNKDFYFSDDTPAKKAIFSVSDPEGGLDGKTYTTLDNETDDKINAIRDSMRVSVTCTPQGGASTTQIFSYTGASYDAQSGLSDANHTSITTEKIEDYGLNTNAELAQDQRHILFTSNKNKHTKVAVRIWCEIMDPNFQRAFNFSRDNQNPNTFSEPDFNAIAGVEINVNLGFGNADNNFRPFYFDDYTFDNTASNRGNNITLRNASNSNYIVWFYGYNKDINDYQRFPMSRETTSGGRTRWSADSVPQSFTDYLQNTDNTGTSGMDTTHLNNCYFAYGTYNSATDSYGTPVYKWNLYEKPGSSVSEFIYNAYSITEISNSASYGVGIWNDASTMRLLEFKDMATATVSDSFNKSASNYQFMTDVADSHSKYNVFVNDSDYGTNYANNFQQSVYRKTAAMYYDDADEVFKAYVPTTWLIDSSNPNNTKTVYFNYSATGYFSRAATNLRWFARGATASNNVFIYTAVGYQDNHLVDPVTGGNGYYAGVGTWGSVDKINFSTELVDYDHASAYRYYIGIKGSYGQNINTEVFYSMVPNAACTLYSVYVPHEVGIEIAEIDFIRYNNYNPGTNSSATINARWYADSRHADLTYYPVMIDSSATASDFTRGYWNLSVLVDGTYENLIYDTLTDGNSDGKLEYSTDGGTTYTTITEDSAVAGTPTTDTNRIDAYRWYVPCASGTTVTYRWTPYKGSDGNYGTSDDTVFIFTHATSNGMYCVVTEPENEMFFAQGTGTTERLSARMRLQQNDLDLETEIQPSTVESDLALQGSLNNSEEEPTTITDLFNEIFATEPATENAADGDNDEESADFE